jgi:hypothetical protein
MASLPTSWAAGVGVAADNKQFATTVEVLARKHLLIGSYDETITTVVENVPFRVSSAEEVGDLTGRGFMLHRMAVAAFAGSYGNVETWCIAQPEDGAAANATGTIVVAGPATAAGTLTFYVNGKKYSVAVADEAIAGDIGDLIEDEINADLDAPVTALNVAGTVTLTSKSGGTFGNGISVTMGWSDEPVPAGLTVTLTEVGGVVLGATDPDIDDALTALGTGDNANNLGFTDVNVGYGLDDSDVLDAIAAYVGWGNTQTGCYDPLVGRPFRCLFGDVTEKDPDVPIDGLDLAVTLAADRTLDRANGLICAPDSPVHPTELACQVMGVIARKNSVAAEAHALNEVLTGIIPGRLEVNWTTEYDNRDYAVKNGVGTTMEKGGVLTIQNVLSFYNPVAVPMASNGYRSMRNISIIQNMLAAVRAAFEAEKWSGVSIVVDVAKVGNATDRAKARDLGSVVDDLLALTEGFGNRAWVSSAAWTKERIAAGGLVTIRAGANGFDFTLPVLLSGEAGIYNGVIEFDTSLAILL